MRVLYLTNNPNLVSSTRILQGWLLASLRDGQMPCVAVQQQGAFVDWLAEQGIPCQVNPMPWPNRKKPFHSLWQVWRLARWARRRGVELIHCNEHDIYPFGALVARFARRPVLCNIRCKIEQGFGSWAFRRREPEALLWSTPQMRGECEPALGRTVRSERQHILSEGVDLEWFGNLGEQRRLVRREWQVQAEQIVVGMACALRPGKRVEDFLDMAERIRATAPDVCFVLAGGPIEGDEAYRDFILPRIEAAVERGTVRWLGHLEPVEPFFHGIDVAVSTSEHESFGMSVCEAMACRKPVVAYRACSVEEVVGDAGRVVETGDLDALTAAVSDLIRDAELRQELGRQARERVEARFQPSVIYRELKQIYAAARVAGLSRTPDAPVRTFAVPNSGSP